MEPEAHGGDMVGLLPVLRGAGESSGQLEGTVQSNVSMFKLSVNSGMEGDYWFWFFSLSVKVNQSCLTATAIKLFSVLPGGKIRKLTRNEVPRISQ